MSAESSTLVSSALPDHRAPYQITLAVDARAYAAVLNAAIDARLEGRELDDGDE